MPMMNENTTIRQSNARKATVPVSAGKLTVVFFLLSSSKSSQLNHDSSFASGSVCYGCRDFHAHCLVNYRSTALIGPYDETIMIKFNMNIAKQVTAGIIKASFPKCDLTYM